MYWLCFNLPTLRVNCKQILGRFFGIESDGALREKDLTNVNIDQVKNPLESGIVWSWSRHFCWFSRKIASKTHCFLSDKRHIIGWIWCNTWVALLYSHTLQSVKIKRVKINSLKIKSVRTFDWFSPWIDDEKFITLNSLKVK